MTETGDEVPRSWGEEFVERAAEDTQPYELVLEIARKHLERGRAAMNQPTRPTWGTGAYRTVADWLETAEDNASEFLVYLRQAPQVAKAMKSSADLRRMYRKWVTEKRSPAGKELWQVISSALLALEKSGIVERAPEYRGYFNHNNVRWYLKGRGGRQARHLDPDQIANAIPLPSPKSAGRKILSPTEARTIIKNLLTLANGEITMQEIVKSITPHLLLFKTDYMDPVRSDDGGETSTDPIETLATHVVPPYARRAVAEEIERRSRCIWDKVATLRRGRKVLVEGLRVLCCYFLPTAVFGKKANLEDFGPTSTVQDVLNDIRGVMAHCLDGLSQTPIAADRTALPAEEIVAGILSEITRKCSENGYCTAFS